MRWKDAASIESTIWDCKLADLPRSANRARINELFDGFPPYSPEEVAQNRINSNVNFLDANRIAHDARGKFSGAFLKPGNYMKVQLDYGPKHRRQEWSEIITREINRQMKASLRYSETLRNVFGQLVLHGVGPVVWDDPEGWCPTMQMMPDVLLPSRTLRTMENLSYFAVFRRYTAAKLYRMTHGPKVDKGWNMPVVLKALEWAHKQRGRTISANEAIWTPEKIIEDIKCDTGYFSSDQVPTIDCWDFYFLDDEDKEWGWKRRIVMDTPSQSEASGISGNTKNILGSNNQFLYDPGTRNYAAELSQIAHFQYADGSVVAPFRYHSVRSLGFLLYAPCHLQNRLRCKFNDHVFESLLQYFRVSNPDDAERLTKVDLLDLGIIPEGLAFVRPEERWQIQGDVVSTALNLNRSTIADNSTSYTQDFGVNPDQPNPDKTATQVAAEVNAATAMVGGMLQDAYGYQTFQYVEIARRFCKRNSRDAAVQKFRAAALRQGVPAEMIDVTKWNVTPERVLGNGNKQIELSQSSMLMQQIDRYDPDSQRIILRNFTFAATDDPSLTMLLVPEEKNLTTDSVHDAQLSAATLLLALPMGLRQGVNHGEYAATLLGMLSVEIQKLNASGGMATDEQLAGLQNLAGQSVDGQPIPGNGAMNHIQILAQNKGNKAEVKQLSDALGKLLNEVKGFAQRLQEQQQQAQGQNGNGNQLDPTAAAKLKGMLVLAETKAANSKLSHEQKLQQRQESHQLQMANEIRRTQVDEAATDLRTAGDIRRDGQKEIKEQAGSA